jgi:hypothetical protein
MDQYLEEGKDQEANFICYSLMALSDLPYLPHPLKWCETTESTARAMFLQSQQLSFVDCIVATVRKDFQFMVN